MKKTALIALVFSILLLVPAFPQTEAYDKQQIQEVIKKIDAMWYDPEGLKNCMAVTSERFIWFFPGGTMNKQEFFGFMEKILQKSFPQTHTRSDEKLVVNGSIAFNYVVLNSTNAVINVFCKEKGSWKYFMMLPPDLLREVLAP